MHICLLLISSQRVTWIMWVRKFGQLVTVTVIACLSLHVIYCCPQDEGSTMHRRILETNCVPTARSSLYIKT